MSTPHAGEPVDPGTFDLLDLYLAAAEKREIDAESPVKPPAPIATFLDTFFRQFFERGWNIEIGTIDETAKAQATRTRLGRDRKTELATIKLIASFEELCDLWPDLLGFEYGGNPVEVERFHKTYLPRLLRKIGEWARDKGHPLIQERADSAASRLKQAMR